MTSAKKHDPDTGITVLVCAYNRNHYMDTVYRTIAAQTLQPAEIIVVDDGSEPPVPDPALSHPNLKNLRILRLDKNQGLANARNVGIEAARAPFIAMLDTDDRWRPHKLERQMAVLRRADKDVFGVLTAFERHGRAVRAGVVRTPEVEDWYHAFLMGIRCGPGSTLLMRREAAQTTAKFDTGLKRYEDWDWLLNVTASRRYRFLCIDEPLADVELSGRPDPGLSMQALETIARRHMPRLTTGAERRLFRAALSIEQASVSRWSGNVWGFIGHALKAAQSPAIIKRELKLTLNRPENS